MGRTRSTAKDLEVTRAFDRNDSAFLYISVTHTCCRLLTSTVHSSDSKSHSYSHPTVTHSAVGPMYAMGTPIPPHHHQGSDGTTTEKKKKKEEKDHEKPEKDKDKARRNLLIFHF